MCLDLNNSHLKGQILKPNMCLHPLM